MRRRSAAGLVTGGLLGMTGLAAALTDAWVGRPRSGSLAWTAGRVASRRALAWASAGATRAWARRSLASPLPSSPPSPLPLAWIGAGPGGRAVAVTLGSRSLVRLLPDGGGTPLSVAGTFVPGGGADGPGRLLMARLRAREVAAGGHFSESSIPARGTRRLTGRESTQEIDNQGCQKSW